MVLASSLRAVFRVRSCEFERRKLRKISGLLLDLFCFTNVCLLDQCRLCDDSDNFYFSYLCADIRYVTYRDIFLQSKLQRNEMVLSFTNSVKTNIKYKRDETIHTVLDIYIFFLFFFFF